MWRLRNYLCSSVGKKQLIGITGLGLSFFVLTHMLGNLLVFVSPEAYNRYGHSITSGMAYPFIEIALLAAFLVHVSLTVWLTLENRRARPTNPKCVPLGDQKAARFASRSMILTGLLVFVFVVIHVKMFRLGPVYPVEYGADQIRDLYQLMREEFTQPSVVAWYVFSMVILGLHLSHGIAATFQSLGFAGVSRPILKYAGYGLAIAIAVGFMSQPLYIWLTGGE